MKPKSIVQRLSPGLAVLVLWGAAFCLACRLPPALISGSQAPVAGSTAERLLGSTCTALGDQFYETADLYFHKGVPHTHKQAFSERFFQRLGTAIRPTGHHHAEGQAVREIMPWLRLTTRLDPHRLDPYFVTVYWLVQKMDQPDVAFRVLDEAQRNNPFNYRVHFERGRLYIFQKEWNKAAREFDAGLTFWPGADTLDSEEARMDKRNLLLHRELLYEWEGRTQEAATSIREILRLFPATQGALLERLAALESGRKPAVPARVLLESLADKTESKYTACHRCEEDEHEHEH